MSKIKVIFEIEIRTESDDTMEAIADRAWKLIDMAEVSIKDNQGQVISNEVELKDFLKNN